MTHASKNFMAVANHILANRDVTAEAIKTAISGGMKPAEAKVVSDCIDAMFALRELKGVRVFAEAQAEERFDLTKRALQTQKSVSPEVFSAIIKLAAAWVERNRGDLEATEEMACSGSNRRFL